jgi:hypothetical protein
MKIAFGCMVNDSRRLNMVLCKSEIGNIPCYTIMYPESATKGLNKLLDIIESKGAEIGILTHQDVYYRNGWIEQMQLQVSLLPDSWIVAGIIGKNQVGKLCGIIHDMRQPTYVGSRESLPVECFCMDECCMIINIKSGFRFDEILEGFDLYGTLAVLQVQEMGGSAWIIDAPMEHYCMRSYDWFPDEKFKKSWKWLYDRFPGQRLDSTIIREKVEEEPEVKIKQGGK